MFDDDPFDLIDRFEARADFSFLQDRELELADRSRAEYRAVTLTGRLLASAGDTVTLLVSGVGPVTGVLARVAGTWVEVRSSRRWLVCGAALMSVAGASERSLPEVARPAAAALGLGSPLRELAAEGVPVRAHLVDGRHHDGTLVRIGADFAELAVGSPPRDLLLPFAALAAVSVGVPKGWTVVDVHPGAGDPRR